jgi:murein DD-endopeptidase MepM/ murein hydrolase activator NlpD
MENIFLTYIRPIFILLFFLQSLHAYTLYDNRIEDKIWKSGETLLGFMQENMLPLKLYYEMDSEDEKLSSDIRSSTICHILRDDDYEIRQALIPLNEELQLHIFRERDKTYTMSVEPILYQSQKKSLVLTLDDVLSKDIVAKTGNFQLSVELEQIFKKSFDFRKLKLNDKIAIFYTQKTRMGKFYGTQIIDAAMIKNGSKKHYLFLAKDGNYYDDKAKTTDTTSFIQPCKYRRISSRFTKKRWHPILRRYRAHHGIDYAGPSGTPIKAAFDGKVIFMGTKGGYGKTIVIRHKGGYKTLYAHLSRYKNSVRKSYVKKGTVIGYMGNTGKSTGSHLHFGLSLNNRWINPEHKITFRGGLKGSKKQEFLKIVKGYKGRIGQLLEEV